MSQLARAPSWQALLKATAIAAVLATLFDLAISLWRTPLGWSPAMILAYLGIGVAAGFVLAGAVALGIALPFGRLLARRGYFRRLVLFISGAVFGALLSILASALGNTYVFMSGQGFWDSFIVAAFFGAMAGYLWWVLEKRRGLRGRPGVNA